MKLETPSVMLATTSWSVKRIKWRNVSCLRINIGNSHCQSTFMIVGCVPKNEKGPILSPELMSYQKKDGGVRVPTIRENQGKIFPSGKSGNFNNFCQESGKVREFWSGLGKPNCFIYFYAYFCNNLLCRYKFFPRFAWIYFRYLSNSCCEVRESQGKWPRNVKESQGI